MKNWKLNVLTLSCLAVLSACSSSGSGRACCDATVAPNAGAKPAATPATSTDVKPAETKPAETKPEASKPAEEAKAPEATKPAETQPAEPEATKPAEESKAPEATKPAETQPAEPEATKPAEEPKAPEATTPAETQPAEPEATKPAEEPKAPEATTPAETQPAEPEATKPAEEPKAPEATTPAETQPAEPEATKPAEEPKAPEATTPAETQPAEPEATKPAEEPKAPEATIPAETQPAEPEATKPAEEPKAPAVVEKPTTFAEALAKGFEADGTGTLKGSMARFDAVTYDDTYNGVIINVANEHSNWETGDIRLRNEKYSKNGRTDKTALTDYFSLDNLTTITLLNSPEDLKNFVGLRAIDAGDFPKNVTGKDGKERKNSYYPTKKHNAIGFMGSRFGTSSNYDGFASIRFGVYTDQDDTSYLFVHGKPGSGPMKAEYRGSAIYGKNGAYNALPDSVVAKILNRNGKQVVDIDIKVDDSKTWSFGGDVIGNIFEGKRGDIYTKGGFFGYSDMGGAFQIQGGADVGTLGVFGATDDKDLWKGGKNRTK